MRSKVPKAPWEVNENKANGVDELPIELTQAAGKTAITALTEIC